MHADDVTANTPPRYEPASRPLGVLVGYDGSEQALLALHYAARAAQRLGTMLTVATAYTVPAKVYPNIASIPAEPDQVARQAAAELVLEEAEHQLRGYPGRIQLRTAQGDAAGVLVHLSATAQLAVVGARGRGGFLGRVLGSVSSALPAHAHCPTVVVPRQYEIARGQGPARFAPVEDQAPVVVGVDRSPHSRIAMAVAVEAARGRRAPLHLLMVIPSPESWGGMYSAMLPDLALIEQQRLELAADLEATAADLHRQHPNLTVTCEVQLADPASELIDRSAEAQLTVVGTRGHSRLASALLGSVSQSVLHHAAGPVMVVPDLGTFAPADGQTRF